VMRNEVDFYRMQPHDELLAHQQALRVYALAEPGQQYLVFAPDGECFSLQLEAGDYSRCCWIDSKSGKKQALPPTQSTGPEQAKAFTPPNKDTDWVLVVRK